MPEATHQTEQAPRELLRLAIELKKKNRFEDIAALAAKLARPLGVEHLPAADEIAFALGHLRRTSEAANLLEEAFRLEPSHRRASALAYLFYDAALALLRPGSGNGGLDREAIRKMFRHWIGQALSMRPESIKDLYRLGVFEAQVESQHDVPALRALLGAIESFRKLAPDEQELRGDLRKYCTKALYAAGRSALRLRKLNLARKLSFACIREDRDVDHVDPLIKLHLAAKVCLATQEYDHAERAARLALDSKGPPRRDFLFGLLARICIARGDPQAGAAWIEDHVRPQRRDAALWRLLGDARRAAGDLRGATAAYESALSRDRGGRHLTLVSLGEVALAGGELGKAKHHFETALRFRRKHYASDDERATEGLAAVERATQAGMVDECPGLAKGKNLEPMDAEQTKENVA